MTDFDAAITEGYATEGAAIELGRRGVDSPPVHLPEVPHGKDFVQDQIGASKSASQRERSSSIGSSCSSDTLAMPRLASPAT